MFFAMPCVLVDQRKWTFTRGVRQQRITTTNSHWKSLWLFYLLFSREMTHVILRSLNPRLHPYLQHQCASVLDEERPTNQDATQNYGWKKKGDESSEQHKAWRLFWTPRSDTSNLRFCPFNAPIYSPLSPSTMITIMKTERWNLTYYLANLGGLKVREVRESFLHDIQEDHKW